MKKSNVTPIRANVGADQTQSAREFRDQIVGKRISAVVAKPGRAGQPPQVLMMQFDDGSVVEWVSPRSDAVLRRALSHRAKPGHGTAHLVGPEVLQLPLMELGEYGRG